MNRIMQFNLTDIMPEQEAVLRNQGIPEGTYIQNRICTLLAKARDVFAASAQPVGTLLELSIKECETIFNGEGKNAKDIPVERILTQADNLALFALTMGSEVSEIIGELFKDNEFALGSMLDAVASLAADKAVEVYETYYFDDLSKRDLATPETCVLSYSPGYCGWHISGQKQLFHYLEPEKIGISLNDSFLMTPLKSVTGLLVAGKKEIHLFNEGAYDFCNLCKDRTCQERMQRLLT